MYIAAGVYTEATVHLPYRAPISHQYTLDPQNFPADISRAADRIHFIRIRIQLQHFRLNRYRSGSRALRTKNWKKITVEKLFLDQKLQFTYS
jgi:hypothetical protein